MHNFFIFKYFLIQAYLELIPMAGHCVMLDTPDQAGFYIFRMQFKFNSHQSMTLIFFPIKRNLPFFPILFLLFLTFFLLKLLFIEKYISLGPGQYHDVQVHQEVDQRPQYLNHLAPHESKTDRQTSTI